MKILLVSDVSIHAVIGGAERVLYELAVGLQLRGHKVHILTRRLPEHESSQEINQGVREWRYDIDTSSSLSFLSSTFRNGAGLFKELQNEHAFDCINGHQPFSVWAIRRCLQKKGIPFIYTCLSFSFEEYLSRRTKAGSFLRHGVDVMNAYLRKRIEKGVLASAKSIIVLSRFTRDKLMTIYGTAPDCISIIPGGVDIHRFYPVNDRKTIRTRLHLPTDRFILLTVRNLVPRMGLENLITAMRVVVAAVPDVSLVVGGTGPLKASLLRQRDELKLQDNVLFTGFIAESDLPDYYRSADVFILPTIELEGFGLVTLEALASGTPVLGTPVGGTLEILGQLDKNCLFRNISPDALAELIIASIQRFRVEPDYWKSVSYGCRQFVEENYSWERYVDAMEKTFFEIVERDR